MSRKLFQMVAMTLFLLPTAIAQNNNAKPAESTPKRPLGIVNEFTIKPGMMPAFMEWAEKEAKPLYVKAGVKTAYFFTNIYDVDRSVVTFIEVHENFAAIKARNEAFTKNNSQEVREAWSTKAREFIAGTRTYMIEGLSELGWMNPKLKSPPLYYIVTERFVAPMRGADYEAFLKNDWLPLVKKADANGMLVSRLRFGGELGHYFVYTPVTDLTELDQPGKVAQTVGAEALAKTQQKLVGIIQRSENRILRLRPELCILPPPPTTASK
ncbi:MAG: hypothetical protein JST84_18375 [Acidobacteria bacterium]|nr:hypothetical protein [Acidobacteriota bacterium]